MKKKIMSLLLAVTIMTGLFVGCGGNANNNKDEKDLIKILGVDRSSDGKMTELEGWKETLAGKRFLADLDALNIEIEFEWIPWDNFQFKSTIAAKIASGMNVPDTIWMYYDSDVLMEWGEMGSLLAVDELLEQYDEDGSIMAFYEEYLGNGLQSHMRDGKLYYFPNVSSYTLAINEEGEEMPWSEHLGYFMIREDWVRAVGEEVKEMYTPDELYDLVLKMQEADVNGNGKPDEVLFTKLYDSDYCGMAFAFGMSPYQIDLAKNPATNKLTILSNWTDDNFVPYIEYLQKCLADGVMSEDQLTNPNGVPYDSKAVLFAGSKIQGKPETDDNWKPILVDYDGDYTNGYYIFGRQGKYESNSEFAITSACENPEAVVRLVDYFCSEEFGRLNQYGVEDVGYTLTENGAVQDIYDAANVDTWSLHDLGLANSYLDNTVSLSSAKRVDESVEEGTKRDILTWCYDFYNDIYPYCWVYGAADPTYTKEEETTINRFKGPLRTRMLEFYADLILGRRSIDEIPTMIKELEKLKMQEVLDAYEAVVERYNNGN